MATRNRRLVLHFDLNNTILMKDNAKGISSVQANVQRIVAKSAWGRVTPATESDEASTPHWVLIHDQLSWTKPLIEGGEDLVSYYDYLKEAFPTKDHPNADQNKAILADRLNDFAKAGNPGAKFKNTQEKMLKCLTLPKGASEELNFPLEIKEKILNGEPLWDASPERRAEEGGEDDEPEEAATKGGKQIS